MAEATSIVYVSDMGGLGADYLDLAFLLRSSDCRLRGACVGEDGWTFLNACRTNIDLRSVAIIGYEATHLAEFLEAEESPITLVVTSCYKPVAELLEQFPNVIRAKVSRIFLVGGHVNDYSAPETIRVPIDPRLRERNPAYFSPGGDPRIKTDEEQTAFATILTSGQAVIWLPRDVCLWRYYTAEIIENWDVLRNSTPENVLLSTLPAFLLAAHTDATLWLRWFRAVPARVETDDMGKVSEFTTRTDAPNIYGIVAVDGQGLGKLMTARLQGKAGAP